MVSPGCERGRLHRAGASSSAAGTRRFDRSCPATAVKTGARGHPPYAVSQLPRTEGSEVRRGGDTWRPMFETGGCRPKTGSNNWVLQHALPFAFLKAFVCVIFLNLNMKRPSLRKGKKPTQGHLGEPEWGLQSPKPFAITLGHLQIDSCVSLIY